MVSDMRRKLVRTFVRPCDGATVQEYRTRQSFWADEETHYIVRD